MSTLLILAATWLYLWVCVAAFLRPGSVPFEALLWGGLILIAAWWGHDAAHNRRGHSAYRTREVVR